MSAPVIEYATPPLREPDLRGHLPALDGVRGLAIFGVMLYHMTVLTSYTTLDQVVRVATHCGGYGVDLFFVLSGFLITGILVDAKSQPHFFRNFYARRTLRIFPLYYAVVFFSLVILPHIPNPKAARFGSIAGDEIWYWTYLSNYLVAIRQEWRHGILDVSWTLAIEEQFYLLWPAVVYLLGRRALVRVCVGLIVTSAVVRTAMVVAGANPLSVIVITPSKMDALAVGALVAVVTRQTGVVKWLVTARRAMWISLACFVVIFAAGDWGWDGRPMLCVGYTAIAVFGGSVIVLALPVSQTPSALQKFLGNPMPRMLGRYSYAMYLFHLPLRAVVRDTIYGPDRFPTLAGSQMPGQLIFYLVGIGVTLAAAVLSWNLYEKQFLKLKRYFPAGHAATQTAPPDEAVAMVAPPRQSRGA